SLPACSASAVRPAGGVAPASTGPRASGAAPPRPPPRRGRAGLSFFPNQGLPPLFAAVAIESFGIPVPGETALIAVGVLASQGHYSIVTVIALAAAAAIIGDNLGFWLIGRRGGRALIARFGWVERRTQHVLPRAEALIDRYG